MGNRGNYLPSNHDSLPAYDGFYIDNKVLYTTDDIEKDWNMLTEQVCKGMIKACPALENYNAWKPCSLGQSRFTLLSNQYVDVILETEDKYTAIYIIVPESCEFAGYAKRIFKSYVNLLKDVLIKLYPGYVRHRKNAWESILVG